MEKDTTAPIDVEVEEVKEKFWQKPVVKKTLVIAGAATAAIAAGAVIIAKTMRHNDEAELEQLETPDFYAVEASADSVATD